MGLFNFLKPKNEQMPITTFSRNLSINEKVAITSAMFLIVNQHGKRQIHPTEFKYIQDISKNIIGLDEKDLLATRPEGFDFPTILKAMSEKDRKYFSFVFYSLANIMQDKQVIGLASHIIKDIGCSVDDVSKNA